MVLFYPSEKICISVAKINEITVDQTLQHSARTDHAH